MKPQQIKAPLLSALFKCLILYDSVAILTKGKSEHGLKNNLFKNYKKAIPGGHAA